MRATRSTANALVLGAVIYGVVPTVVEMVAGATLGNRNNLEAWALAMLVAAGLGPWAAVRLAPKPTEPRGAILGLLSAILGFLLMAALHVVLVLAFPKVGLTFTLPEYWIIFQPFLWLVALAFGMATGSSMQRKVSRRSAAA